MEIFKKLNLKDQTNLLVLNSPLSFEPEIGALSGVHVSRNLIELDLVDFALAFVVQKAQIDAFAPAIAAKAAGDALIWFAYPKGTSKKYRCDFNRDSGWDSLGRLGFEPVRQVAIDEDWSALRFRRVEFIKKLTRGFAMTEEGQNRVQKS